MRGAKVELVICQNQGGGEGGGRKGCQHERGGKTGEGGGHSCLTCIHNGCPAESAVGTRGEGWGVGGHAVHSETAVLLNQRGPLASAHLPLHPLLAASAT